MTQEITKEEWLRRCAAQYMSKGGVSEAQAMEFAEACWDQRIPYFTEFPEDAADSDMEYWEDD